MKATRHDVTRSSNTNLNKTSTSKKQKTKTINYLTEHFMIMMRIIIHILDMEMVKSRQLKNLDYTVELI